MGSKESKKRRGASAVQPLGAGDVGSFASLCRNEAVIKVVRDSMVKEAKRGKLVSSEIPSAIYLEPEPWLPDSGLVTPTLKLKRPKLREHYTHAIEQMYQASTRKQSMARRITQRHTTFVKRRTIMTPRGSKAKSQALEAEAKVQEGDICTNHSNVN